MKDCPVRLTGETTALAIPKSDRYTWPGRPGCASTRMFAGLTSRCTSPAACAASSAEATATMSSAARAGAGAPSRASIPRRSPPRTKRIAMNSAPAASPASYTGMMCGSSTFAAARDSARNRRRNAGSAARAGPRIFSATSRSSRTSRARNTTAIPPVPASASSRYPATSEPGRNPAGYAGKLSLTAPPGGPGGPGPRSSRAVRRGRAVPAGLELPVLPPSAGAGKPAGSAAAMPPRAGPRDVLSPLRITSRRAGRFSAYRSPAASSSSSARK